MMKAREFWIDEELRVFDYEPMGKHSIKVIESISYEYAIDALKEIAQFKEEKNGLSSSSTREADLAQDVLLELGEEI